MVQMRNESGQAITEYILLIAMLTTIFVGVRAVLGKSDFMNKMMIPLKGDFSHAYQYGYPKALGFDDGGPDMHPRAIGGNNFRIFYVSDPK